MEKDDTLWFFSGSPVPFILRPEKEYYRLVGEGYVEGVDLERVVSPAKISSGEEWVIIKYVSRSIT